MDLIDEEHTRHKLSDTLHVCMHVCKCICFENDVKQTHAHTFVNTHTQTTTQTYNFFPVYNLMLGTQLVCLEFPEYVTLIN